MRSSRPPTADIVRPSSRLMRLMTARTTSRFSLASATRPWAGLGLGLETSSAHGTAEDCDQPVMMAWISSTGMVRVALVPRRSSMVPDSPPAVHCAVHFWVMVMVTSPRSMYWWRRSPVG